MNIKKFIIMANLLVKKNGEGRAKYLKNHHIFHNMGEHCYWHPIKIPNEPFLLELHNNVSIAANVTFITHDILHYVFNSDGTTHGGDIKLKLGKIEIFDNVFIGANSTIIYNTKIGPNVIIAAGSVVTKDIPEGSVVGGNPARVIGDYYSVREKYLNNNAPSFKDGYDKIEDFFW